MDGRRAEPLRNRRVQAFFVLVTPGPGDIPVRPYEERVDLWRTIFMGNRTDDLDREFPGEGEFFFGAVGRGGEPHDERLDVCRQAGRRRRSGFTPWSHVRHTP